MEEFSFLTEASLLALQSAPFTLATLTFTALDNPGNVVLQLINLASSSLGGVAGAALGDDLQTPNSLQVSIVPEPATALLGAAGLALLGLWARSTRD
jgi:membrane protein YqaA with SNARE-associated domain